MLQAYDGAGMAHAYLPVPYRLLYVRRQLQQAQVVGHRAALLLHAVRHLFLCQAAFVHQLAVAQRYFYSIQVLALQVLQQCHFQHTLPVRRAHISRYISQPGQLRCPQPALTRYQLVAVHPYLHHRYRLYDVM